jgi:RNA polymerase sigma-70 factor (ECF subfamily)
VAIADLAPTGHAVAGEAAASPAGADGADELGAQRSPPRSAVPAADAPRHSEVARHCANEPDDGLVELCRAGHEDAFDEIVERYQSLLLRHCAQIVRSAAAQDAVQDALLAAWRAIRAGAEIQTLRSWLFTIAHRKALTSLRDRRTGSLELPESLSGGRSPADEAGQSARTRETLAALARLPESQRDALLGTAVHGRSGREIASDLGVNESTVRQLVFRARATLRTTAAACFLPPVFLLRLLRRAATSPSRLAALARSALRPNQADMTGRILKGSALAIVGLTLAAAGAVRIVGSQHGPPSANRSRLATPARRGQRHAATFVPGRSPVRHTARSGLRRSKANASHSHPGHFRRGSLAADGGAPAVRSLRSTFAAPGSPMILASPAAPTLTDPGTIPAPSSLTRIVPGAPASGGRLAQAVTPSPPPSVTGTAQTLAGARTTTAAQTVGAVGSTVQTLPSVGPPAAPSVTPPAQDVAGIDPTGR